MNVINKLMNKINPVNFITTLLLSFFMCGVVSMINQLEAEYFFVALWFKAWMYSWCVAFPTAIVILPLSREMALSLIRGGDTE